MAWLDNMLSNPLFVLFIVTFTGVAIGKMRIKKFSLGVSGALFVGIVAGHIGLEVPHDFFNLTILLFVTAVGLLASRDIGEIIKRYGVKFIALGLLIPSTGALVTYLCVLSLGQNISPPLIEGVFTGALTSSPGLAASLESSVNTELITIGHSVAYPVGVIVTILFVQLTQILTKMDLEEEKALFRKRIGKYDSEKESSALFNLSIFCFAALVGIVIGTVPIPLGPLGRVTLGNAGGGLIGGLIVGYVGRMGPMHRRISQEVLSPLREMMLAFFLAVVGIEAGAGFVSTVSKHGILLIVISILVVIFPILVGYLLGRKVWHFDWILLSGAICGGMTSTPGLGAAIDATGTEDAGAGYGATYPFAIIGMVIFAKLLGM